MAARAGLTALRAARLRAAPRAHFGATRNASSVTYGEDNLMTPTWEQRDVIRRITRTKTADAARPLVEQVLSSDVPIAVKEGTKMMLTLGHLGEYGLATSVYGKLCESTELDAKAHTVAIGVFGRAGERDRALEVFKTLEASPCEVDAHAYNAAIKNAPSVDAVKELTAAMKAGGPPMDVTSYQHAIGVCVEHGDAAAEELLDEMTTAEIWPNAATYDHLIGFYRSNKRNAEVLDALDGMMQLGLAPSKASFHTALEVHAEAGALDKAEDTVARMLKGPKGRGGFPATQDTYRLLMRASAVAEDWRQALLYFEIMGRKEKPDSESVQLAYKVLHEHAQMDAADKQQFATTLGLREDIVGQVYGVQMA